MTLLVALVVAGCGSSAQVDRATVAGSVNLGGKPVTGGSIRLVAADDPSRQVHGRIRNDGTFTLTSAPVGRVRVAVETVTATEGVETPDRGAFVPVPAIYARPETTPLLIEIGHQDSSGLTITLTP